MSKKLVADPSLCTACNCCTLACSAAKTGTYKPVDSRVQVTSFPLEGFSVPSICFQCPSAACLKACPEVAIFRDENNTVLVDDNKCTGCGECAEACPYGMIRIENELARKCDLCGGSPECVTWCEPNALTFSEPSKTQMIGRGAQMKHRSETGSASEKRSHLAQLLYQEIRCAE